MGIFGNIIQNRRTSKLKMMRKLSIVFLIMVLINFAFSQTADMVFCGNNNEANSCAQCDQFNTVQNPEWCGGDCRFVINQNTFTQECDLADPCTSDADCTLANQIC